MYKQNPHEDGDQIVALIRQNGDMAKELEHKTNLVDALCQQRDMANNSTAEFVAQLTSEKNAHAKTSSQLVQLQGETEAAKPANPVAPSPTP